MNLKQHKLGCMANLSCLVYHADGVCPGPYGKCTCGHSPAKDQATLEVKKFHCSEHGYIKPIPRCPKCNPTESVSGVHHPHCSGTHKQNGFGCNVENQPQPEWERWARVLGNSTNPRDTDLLVVKIGLERQKEYERGREEADWMGETLQNARNSGIKKGRNDTLDEVEKIVDGLEEMNRDGFTWIRKYDLKERLKANRDSV